jgi:maltooligosyltrehalose trehalohydrolase
MTPLLFMGQEWAASSPFQFFTDQEPDLGARVAEGRRREFAGFRAFADPLRLAAIPDPQDPATFVRSRLRWDERGQGEHARVFALYRALLALRRNDPVLRAAGRDALEVRAEGDLLTVKRWRAGEERWLLLNLGVVPLPLPPHTHGRPILLRSDGPPVPLAKVPPRTAVVLG